MTRRTLILRHRFALGDTVLLTALARDIQLQHPGEFDVLVDCNFREVFLKHPYARLLDKRPEGRVTDVDVRYRNGIRAAGRGQKVHMLAWYHQDFAHKTGIAVHPSAPKASLHLSAEESAPLAELAGERYWVVMAGGKTDITNKLWHPGRWQEVTDKLRAAGITVAQAGAAHREHRHPGLRGTVNLLGRLNSSREFFNLIQHADGVICPVTAAMHVAAAYDKPCVVLAGGREEPWWEAYQNGSHAWGPLCRPVAVEHRFLHTMGKLSCCQVKGCWKHRTVKLNDGRRDYDNSLCRMPVPDPAAVGGAVPGCLDLITAEQVVEAVLSYGGHDYSLVRAPEATPDDVVRIDTPAAPPDVRRPGEPRRPDLIDHPLIGGRLTVFVLCFGDYPDLARTCINSVLETLPADCLDLRVGLNAVCDQTRAYIRSLGKRVTKIYDHPENPGKYVVQREMFHDPACPVATPHLLWLDDDVKAVSENWASDLCRTIVSSHPGGARIYGTPYMHDLSRCSSGGHDPCRWFRQAPWWRGRHLHVRGQMLEAANGSVIRFAVGYAWAMASAMIRLADIPDRRLRFNGGDIVISEQCRQAGGNLKSWNPHKSLFWCPDREHGGRRGFSEPMPWRAPDAAEAGARGRVASTIR